MKISKTDKIFVAGSKGMAGSAICRALHKFGYGNIDLGGRILTPTRNHLNLLDINVVEKWFIKNKPDVVILAAAKVGGIHANENQPTSFILENLKIQNNIIETSWKNGVKRLLFLGSSCIYPKFSEQPIKEEYLLEGTLETTNEFYAIAKIAGIKLCEALRKEYRFDAISLMPTNLYGPGDNYHPLNSHVLPALIRRFSEARINSLKSVTCWGSGKPFREFLHVDDLGDACVFCLENWDPDQHNYPLDSNNKKLYHLNVGSGFDLSISELSLKIANATGFKGDILWDKSKPDGTPRKLLDCSRINSLGWAPKINLDQGLKSTVSLFNQTDISKIRKI